MEKLRVCFKLCMFRVHVRFGEVPFHPTIFFWYPSSCHFLNWDNLLYKYLQSNYISSILVVHVLILLHSNVCVFFNVFTLQETRTLGVIARMTCQFCCVLILECYNFWIMNWMTKTKYLFLNVLVKFVFLIFQKNLKIILYLKVNFVNQFCKISIFWCFNL